MSRANGQAQDGRHCAARDFDGDRRVDELLVHTGEVNRVAGGGLTHHNFSPRAYEEIRQGSPGQKLFLSRFRSDYLFAFALSRGGACVERALQHPPDGRLAAVVLAR